MDTRAQHLLLELYGCDPALLNDALFLAGLMRKAVSASGARVVGETFHAYSPHGVTGVLVIEESHFSVHTWPESGYAALDFYTCGALDPEPAAREVFEGLRASSAQLLEVARGLAEPAGGAALSRQLSWRRDSP
ncbi:MAG TPA: adenosylmethionine decarboxylase [Polyangiaceae bacterium]|jgi:S-adenosylmethionine decarboxylase proenzyme